MIGSSHDPFVLTRGFHDAFLAGAAFAVLGLLATLLLIRTRDSRAHTEIGVAGAAVPEQAAA